MVLMLRGSSATALPVLVAARYQGIGLALDERTRVVDSLGNASIELETSQGSIRSAGACLRYIANLSASTNFGGATPFQRAQIDSWIDWAFNELLPRRLASAVADKRELLQTLVNIGVRGSPIQTSLRARAKTLLSDLAGLNTLLLSRSFLVGNTVTAADIAVASCVSDPLTFLVSDAERASVPNLMRWFRTVRGQAAFVTVAGPVDLTGAREGGMIDKRPQPADCAALAEAAVARNAGFKKKESQRDKEKAAKGKGTGAGGAGAGSGAEAAAPEVTVAATAAQPASNLTDRELSVDEKIAKAEAKLGELDIAFKTVKHAAARTVDDLVEAIPSDLPCTLCKNLFLKAKKKKEENDTMLWLVVAAHDSPSSMKVIQQQLGYGKTTVRFAKNELLEQHLGVLPGSVSPLAAMNDTAQQVSVAIDSKLVGKDNLQFHPLTNEASTIISYADLTKFLAATGHAVTVVELA